MTLFQDPHLFVVLLLFVVASQLCFAKRVPPCPVPPITLGGIKYSVDSDGRDGYVTATRLSDGRELWKHKILHQSIKFWVEEDVQWVYFTNLKLGRDALVIRDEKNRCYRIDEDGQHLKRVDCGNTFPDRPQWPNCKVR